MNFLLYVAFLRFQQKKEGVEYPFWLVEIFCLFEISML